MLKIWSKLIKDLLKFLLWSIINGLNFFESEISLMNYKKLLSIVTAVALSLVLFAGCTSNGSDADKVKIGVIQIVEHPSLNTIRDSFTAEMVNLGYIDGENCTIEYKDCQNESSTANSIIQSFSGDKKDIIIAIATPTALAAANVSDEIPVVFSAVTDPVKTGLVDSLESTGKNITGTSDALQIGKILDFALLLTPDIKKLGYIYNPGEPNSVAMLDEVKDYASKNSIEVVEAAVTTSSEVQQASQVLLTKVDAVFTPNDNTVATAMQVLSNAAIEAKKPVYVGADSMVKDGGFATIGIDYSDLGKETAIMADQILKGEKKASEIPVKVFNEELFMYINKKTAESIGVTIPEDISSNEKTIIF